MGIMIKENNICKIISPYQLYKKHKINNNIAITKYLLSLLIFLTLKKTISSKPHDKHYLLEVKLSHSVFLKTTFKIS